MHERHRRAVTVRGTRAQTRAEAERMLALLSSRDVLWVGPEHDVRFVRAAPRELAAWLGRAFDAVVLDLHEGLDGDLLGRAGGLVWGGGALVLRLPPRGSPPRGRAADLAVWPFRAGDVTSRAWERFERILALHAVDEHFVEALAPARRDVSGSEEQARAVAATTHALCEREPSTTVLLADRGRGKSSALGLALRQALRAQPSLRVAVSGPSRDAVAELLRFANGEPTPPARGPLGWIAPLELASAPDELDVVVIDEAAQLPVPLLVRIVRRHAKARIAFATTCRGYEGTGRGFVLRFLAWARAEPRRFALLELQRPIRWAEGDPLEALVHDVLALDAEPAAIDGRTMVEGPLEHAILDRDTLARDETLLEQTFGLLVHAHYRTTPRDLERMLDAPNLDVHVLRARGCVVAASIVAREGGLPTEICEAMARGRMRLRGHALPDTLMCHAACAEAGALRMARSVRIAVHPALRRRGLARALVEHVHRTYDVDLFGTIFGATAELVRFRRAVGYELVRLGVSRGSRSGEPAAVMLRAVTPRAAALVRELRVELARNLASQVDLLERDAEIALDPALEAELFAELPPVDPPGPTQLRTMVERYVSGPQPADAVADVLSRFVEAHADALGVLQARARTLVTERLLRRRSWRETAAAAGFDGVPAAMRALRPAIRALLDATRRG